MKITFLGTSSGIPTKERNVSCIAFSTDSGEVYLFDCGEGSQHQLQKSDLKSGRVTNIFITHLHGDHLFGLPGLCLSLSNNNPPDRKVLNIYGPLGLRKFLHSSLALSDSRLQFQVNIFELVPPEFSNDEAFLKNYLDSFLNSSVNVHKFALSNTEGLGLQNSLGEDDDDEEGGLTIDDMLKGTFVKWDEQKKFYNVAKLGNLTVTAAPIKHRVFTVGYVLQEDNLPGKLDVEAAKKLGVTKGPQFGKLKNGEDVTLENGTVVKASACVGAEQKGRKVVILGDTCDASGIGHIAQDCDVLTHEATLEDEQEQLSISRGHATPKLAAKFAKSINCKQLILTHFSARFEPEGVAHEKASNIKSVTVLLQQGKEAFGENCAVAADFRSFEIKRVK